MAPAIPCLFGSVTLSTKTTCSLRKDIHLARSNVHKKISTLSLNGRYFWFQSLSLGLLQNHSNSFRSRYIPRLLPRAAIDTNLAMEEQNPTVPSELAEEPIEVTDVPVTAASNDAASIGISTSAVQLKRTRQQRNSDVPPVKDGDLLPGATLTGKITSVMPYGAFVDIGAFTDGLVHISNLSDKFVSDVGTVVSVGQEVKVRILEVNMETRRISLSMRENEDVSKPKTQQKQTFDSADNEKPESRRKSTPKPNRRRTDAGRGTKFELGQILVGTVKSTNRSGSVISLPDGAEGFLPLSEESSERVMFRCSGLEVGEKVGVRVLRISGGKLTLTMGTKDDRDTDLPSEAPSSTVFDDELDEFPSTSPFTIAFLKNKEIAAFLDKRKKSQELGQAQDSEIVQESAESLLEESEAAPAEPATEAASDEYVSMEKSLLEDPSKGSAQSDGKEPSDSDSEPIEASVVITTEDMVAPAEPAAEYVSMEKSLSEDPSKDSMPSDEKEDSEPIEASVVIDTEDRTAPAEPVAEAATEEYISMEKSISEDPSKNSAQRDEKEPSGSEPIKATVMTTTEERATISYLEAETTFKTLTGTEGGPVDESGTDNEDSGIAIASLIMHDATKPEVSPTMQVDDQSLPLEVLAIEDSDTGLSNGGLAEEKSIASEDSVMSADEAVVVSEFAETNDAASMDQIKPMEDNSIKAAVIIPSLVKKLREETGAGMMDCKNALSETGGDIAQAQEVLRKRGLASAEKRAAKVTAEGRIGSYIHDSRIGVLIEVNCETDFVSRGEIFKELVQDLAMQVAACPQVQYLVPEDVPEEVVNKEREIEMQKEDLQFKPEQFRERIVDGRINKRLQEFALLEQPYIKNDKVVVKDWVKQAIAIVGENIKVNRFVRFNLGEGLEKRSENISAEVAAQTASKASPPSPAPTQESFEVNVAKEKIPSVAVSAALVKQLREETGAGMMDCKKALAESDGNLEKAQEYLRKKGIATAAKKSSRITAEGRVGSYIHDSRIGALVEVNSETDFVARNDRFKELVNDLAMQIVACPQVKFVSVEEIPENVIIKEKEIEMQRDDILSKPEHIREKIVEGRIAKRLAELALLEQPFIKDDGLLVKDLISQTVAALGENIKVRRFARFTLGERE